LTEATVKTHLAHIYTLPSASATVPKPSSTLTKLACSEHQPTTGSVNFELRVDLTSRHQDAF
jgi:hypothetical protein